MKHPWVVLKYGGTSVSDPACWDRIAQRVRALLPDHRIWITASAVSQVSNRLERAVEEALAGEAPASLGWIEDRHRKLARELEVPPPEMSPVEDLLEELRGLLEGVRLTGEAPPRLRARIFSFGELASTRIGAAALARRGVRVAWVDARELLTSETRAGAAASTTYLEASVAPRREPKRADAVADGANVVLTQGFLASTQRGEPCVLGRGGSDTSAALFAALTGACRLEIWTDVHGMFTSDPRFIPSARLIRRIGYREAQELAATGAKVLHPACLAPASWAGVPVEIRNSFDPEAEGTHVRADADRSPAVMAVACRTGVTLLTLDTLDMWRTSGFLARAFAPFDELGISVDLVATSQSAVTVTLDRIPDGVDGERFAALVARLEELGRVRVVHPCAVVAVVGRKIRTVLHELGPALAVFREHEVHLLSESSESLNLSFVVNESDARPLLRDLHGRLFPPRAGEDDPEALFGDTWEMLRQRATSRSEPGTAGQARARPPRWWRRRRDELLSLCRDGEARYVYDLPTVRERAGRLRATVPAVRQWFYSMKANPHPEILRALVTEGFGLECVSAGEVRAAREAAGPEAPILFTPNFCPAAEYRFAVEQGAEITVDGPEVLDLDPGLFRDTEVAVRIDPGGGLGHHEKVRTAGGESKFGHPRDELDVLLEAIGRAGAVVVGLHAHVGSGILAADAWARTTRALAELRPHLPNLRWIDPGGGLGVAERPQQEDLDLEAVQAYLAAAASDLDGITLRMEPGRFLVSEAGVLLAPVTQVRLKGGVRFVGVSTGMNSLLRPALYGAWHAIHNLSRIDEPFIGYAHVVGPICETGDVLGRHRLLPETRSGDVLVVENCGAYGAVMASRYNLREAARELALG